MKYNKIKKFCNSNSIKLPLNWYSHCNAIRPTKGMETAKHFMYKARVGFEIMAQGGTIFTEFEFDRGGVSKRMKYPTCDLFWLDSKTVIEFESNYNEKVAELKHIQFRPYESFVLISQHEVLKMYLKK